MNSDDDVRQKTGSTHGMSEQPRDEEEQFSVPSVDVENEIRHNGAPDRFILCSGGVNSVAMAHKMLEEEWSDNYTAWDKRPVVIYADTTIGLSSQRIYVELLAREYNWQLWKCQTQQPFEEYSEENGFHGNQGHNGIFNVLKGRQFQTIATKSANPHLYFGSLIEEKGDHINRMEWRDDLGAYTHNPILNWSEQDCVDYLRDRGVPYNPNWEAPHFTDCGCGATASREELIELEAEGYEVFAEKLRELEKRVKTGDKRETWAWGSFEPDEQQWMDAEADEEQTQLSDLGCGGDNCSSSCLGAVPDGGQR